LSIFLVMENGLNVTFPAPAPLLWDPLAEVGAEAVTGAVGAGWPPAIAVLPANTGDEAVINAARPRAALNICGSR
jgi:hypothetical protein